MAIPNTCFDDGDRSGHGCRPPPPRPAAALQPGADPQQAVVDLGANQVIDRQGWGLGGRRGPQAARTPPPGTRGGATGGGAHTSAFTTPPGDQSTPEADANKEHLR